MTANIAALLAARGQRVCVVDTDIQSPGIHILFGLHGSEIEYTLNTFLWGKQPIDKVAIDVSKSVDPNLSGRLYLLPSSMRSDEIARILREGYDPRVLTTGLRQIATSLDLDTLIIDTHPGLNEETLLSIALSHRLVVVMRPDQQDYEGTAVTIEVANALNVPQTLMIVNKIPAVYDLAEVEAQVRQSFGCEVAATIRHSDELMALASQGIFAVRFPEHPISQILQRVADLLIAEVPELDS
jgi:MinD-like ATPase involved in chromosome partitioning or flagellar assembly